MNLWREHVERWKDCQRCPLAKQRYRICLGRGTVRADSTCDIVFIGIAPGEIEDNTGQPFRGPAGQTLDQIIERAIPENVPYALTNLVCCYPREAKMTGHEEPSKEEILACRPRLVEFINMAKPRLLVCVGQLPTQHIDHDDTIPCHDMVHPAAILRNDKPMAQKQFETEQTAVRLRIAVERMLEETPKPFVKWGDHAKHGPEKGLRQRFDAWEHTHADIDIPF